MLAQTPTKENKHCFVHCGERCDCTAGKPMYKLPDGEVESSTQKFGEVNNQMKLPAINAVEDYLITEHKRVAALYDDATIGATQRRDFRSGLAEELRKRLKDLEHAMVNQP